MRQPFLIIILLAFACINSFAQAHPEYKNYDWDPDPKPHTLTEAEAKENEIVLKDKRMSEYIYETIEGKEYLVMYVTRHHIVKVNSDKAVEMNNKVYIPMSSVIELSDLKARSVSKTGKVTLLDKANVKLVENYENMGPFKIFAIEGIENGSEVEFLYTSKKMPLYFGTEKMQADEPRKNVEISVISPSNLVFDSKSYNKFPDLKQDSSISGKNMLIAKMDYVRGISPEKYSSYNSSIMRVEYKLAYNKSKGGMNKRLFSWNDAAERIYSSTAKFTSKEKSKVASLLKNIKLESKMTMDEKIRKIESYVKTTFTLKQQHTEDFSDIEKILKNKYANESGFTRLFVALFKEAGIETNLVLTSDRLKTKFDGSFDTWNYLEEYLIYFPETNNYMAPTEILYRYGFPPAEWMCEEGLFIKPIEVGDYLSAVSVVRFIPCNDYKQSYDNIYADLKIDADMNNVNLHIKRESMGYSASSFQPTYSYLPEDVRKQLIDALLKVLSKEDKATDVIVSNYDEASLYRKPFIIEGDVKNTSLLEKAGNKYLFKIGTVIGQQEELYQEGERKTDVENAHNHGYYREITVQIPDGYKITNPEALNFDVFDLEKEERTCEFKSTYKLEGNKLKIMIEEDYRQTHWPLEKFESFRKVINAAADFNKVVLFLEKK